MRTRAERALQADAAEPAMLRRRSRTRDVTANRGHWVSFYKGAAADAVPTVPSAFASWFAGQVPDGARVVDIGCGTGRDSLWLAEQGFDVLGLDYAPTAIDRARAEARTRPADAEFRIFNLYDSRQVLALGGLLEREPAPVYLYARFLLHAVTALGRRNLLLLARSCLRGAGRLYLEFRADDHSGERIEYVFGEHFRRTLDPADVMREIRAVGGHVDHHEAGHGLAVYKREDPYICRVAASWPHRIDR